MGNSFHHIYDPTEAIEEKQHLRELAKDEERSYEEPRAPKDPKYYRYNDTRPDVILQSPWIKNPFTEMFDNHMNLQHAPLCGKIELGMFNCYEAYGLPAGYYKCRDLTDDYSECITESKRPPIFVDRTIGLYRTVVGTMRLLDVIVAHHTTWTWNKREIVKKSNKAKHSEINRSRSLKLGICKAYLRHLLFEFKRCKVMRQERARQHRLGEREIKYAVPPKPGHLQL